VRGRSEGEGEMDLIYTVVLMHEEVGGFSVSVPALPGCFTEGETVPECLDMAREAIRTFIRSMQKCGEAIPHDVNEFPFGLGEALDALVYRVTVPLTEAVLVA
jgi:predicted RNase H-like HicB family nuclease